MHTAKLIAERPRRAPAPPRPSRRQASDGGNENRNWTVTIYRIYVIVARVCIFTLIDIDRFEATATTIMVTPFRRRADRPGDQRVLELDRGDVMPLRSRVASV